MLVALPEDWRLVPVLTTDSLQQLVTVASGLLTHPSDLWTPGHTCIYVCTDTHNLKAIIT